MHLRDLVYIYDSNVDFISENVINFDKMQLIGNVIYGQIAVGVPNAFVYPYAIDRKIQKFIANSLEDLMDEEQLYEESLNVQPLNTPQRVTSTSL